MESKPASIATRSYEDFEPVCKWHREDARDTIDVHLPGFKGEHVKVRVNHLGVLVISGQRPIDGSKWKRFNLEIELPSYCNVNAIHANFVQSILSVVMPKHVSLIPQKEQETRIPEFEHEKEKHRDHNLEFKGQGSTVETKPRENDALREDTNAKGQEFEENNVGLTAETTKDVALKFMVVIIVLYVIGSYVMDVCTSMIPHS